MDFWPSSDFRKQSTPELIHSEETKNAEKIETRSAVCRVIFRVGVVAVLVARIGAAAGSVVTLSDLKTFSL